MTILTVESVIAWRPEALGTAADGLDGVATDIDAARRRVSGAADSLGGVWNGPAADAASGRISRDVRSATQLAEAVRSARDALRTGSTGLGSARTTLVGIVNDASGRGFRVGPDGSVTPPPVPPVMSSPEAADEAAAQFDRQVRAVEQEAQLIANSVSQALTAAGEADRRTAEILNGVEVPAGLRQRVEAFLRELASSRDLYAALGTAGGLLAGGKALKDAWRLFTKGKAFSGFLSNAVRATMTLPATMRFLTGAGTAADAAAALRFQGFVGRFGAAQSIFQFGKPASGFLGGVRTVAGKAFLPLTVVTGVADVVTGGGYDGARGWATRGFGAAGAIGAGALLTGALASNPVGWAIAGGAVLAYGAWSLGNYVYDNWDSITEFAGNAAEWTGDRIADVGEGLSTATDWAGDQLSSAGESLGDAADAVGGVISGGLDALPDVSIF